MKEQIKSKLINFHDKNYKKLLIIPLALILLSFIHLYQFNQKNDGFFYKDISLTGGTTVTIYEKIDSSLLKKELSSSLDSLDTREIFDIVTNEKKAVVFETKTNADETKRILESYLGYNLNEENSSFEFTGSSLSESFFKQLLFSVLIAFVLMSLVVFVLFRTFVPSMAVIFSAFADILMTLVLVNVLEIKLSSAGIVAFLMLIGYSVDTDILLTNKVLKSQGESINKRIFSAFKTGMTMTFTAIVSVALALLITGNFSVILSQIFTILLLGLFFDLLNTWVTNVSIIKWYALKKEK